MNNSRAKEGKLNVVGSKIKYYRELNNLSYQKLSDQLMLLGIDIHKQAIYNIEKGIRTVVITMLTRAIIASIIGVISIFSMFYLLMLRVRRSDWRW